jgi:mannose-6-phosphate isomerase-like protein (cupin superfamily)
VEKLVQIAQKLWNSTSCFLFFYVTLPETGAYKYWQGAHQMSARAKISSLMVLASIASLPIFSVTSFSAEHQQQEPHAKVMKLDSAGKSDSLMLGGPPESVTMRSGLVVLQPNQSVGKHSTGDHEEMLVILEGKGAMLFKDGSRLDLQANVALYCPPQTEHDVVNTGSSVLRYVYVVASTK